MTALRATQPNAVSTATDGNTTAITADNSSENAHLGIAGGTAARKNDPK